MDNERDIDPDATLTGCIWDAIVVGAGMGGAAAAWSLARAGWSVLVLDRGPDHRRNPTAIRGRMLHEPWTAADIAALAEGGRDPESLLLDDGRHRFHHHAFLGAGAGGSSALYGCALERFQTSDFVPRQHHPDAAGSLLPEAWPFAQRHLDPWYASAERQLGVIGGEDMADPAAARAALSPASAALAGVLAGRGLHPYRLRLGDVGDGARGATQGMLCPRGRKRDAANAFLYPAIDAYGAVFLDRCAVEHLDADRTRVTGVVARRHGRCLRFQARHVLLAGGAIRTPALLLASRSPQWPTGLANRSGWVGRGLMRHFVDLYAIALDRRLAGIGGKELGCNDWYVGDGFKLGTLQSFGPLPPASALADALAAEARENGHGLAARAVRLGAPLVAAALARALAHREVLATIVEDLPYPEQCVRWSADAGIEVVYPLRPEAHRRIAHMRRLVDGALRDERVRRIPAGEDLRRLAHGCGTCRSGDDVKASVVDAWCRAHDLDNLHVVDASWLPSSGGTNPGLTIAANALRVACRLAVQSPPAPAVAGQDSSSAYALSHRSGAAGGL